VERIHPRYLSYVTAILLQKYVARLTTKDCFDRLLNANEKDMNSVISNYYQYGLGGIDKHLIIDLLTVCGNERRSFILKMKLRLFLIIDIAMVCGNERNRSFI